MTTYEEMQQALEENEPGLWARVYPRAYHRAGAWPSPKVPATVFGAAVRTVRANPYLPGLRRDVRNIYLLGCLCAQHDFPTYFVTRPLLEAVSRSRPPADLRWAEINLPHPGFIFMLPHGALHHPVHGEIPFLALGRWEAATPITFSSDLVPARTGDTTLFMVSAAHLDPTFPLFDNSLSSATSPLLKDVNVAKPGFFGRLNAAGEMVFEAQTLEENEWQWGLVSLAIRLVLTMQARPALVQLGAASGKRVKNSPTEFWSPNILGAGFRVQREPGGGTHASPQLHWREGHYRLQRYGEGSMALPKEQRPSKPVWIESTLVGGK